MIRNTEMKIYDIDNDWNKRERPIRGNITNIVFDRVKNIEFNFIDGTHTNVEYVKGFEFDSEFNIVITDSMTNIALYNAFSRKLGIKNIKVDCIVIDVYTKLPYCVEMGFNDLKVSRVSCGANMECCTDTEYTLVDINEEL